MITRRTGVLGALLLAASSCGRDKHRSADSAAPSATAGGVAATRPAGADGCPRTGHWSACQVKKRLEQAGVAPRIATSPAEQLPTLAVAPTVYDVGNSNLAIYLFADTLARRSAARGLDTLHFVAPTHALTMRGEATAIESDNLLALLYSRKEQQRERVSDALGAGPPQP